MKKIYDINLLLSQNILDKKEAEILTDMKDLIKIMIVWEKKDKVETVTIYYKKAYKSKILKPIEDICKSIINSDELQYKLDILKSTKFFIKNFMS